MEKMKKEKEERINKEKDEQFKKMADEFETEQTIKDDVERDPSDTQPLGKAPRISDFMTGKEFNNDYWKNQFKFSDILQPRTTSPTAEQTGSRPQPERPTARSLGP